jgi:hypothetical protein
MNPQVKTILLTILTLSVFAIAMVELSGVSKTAILNKWNGDELRLSQVAALPKTVMSFDDTKFNFGKITDGDKVHHAFYFTNTGKNPLVISDAIATCGCTVPSYPKKPIPPGGRDSILVEFNSAGKVGHQRKNVLIKSNSVMEAISIGFEVDVLEKP